MRTGFEKIGLILLAIILIGIWMFVQGLIKEKPAQQLTEADIQQGVLYYPDCSNEEGAENPCDLVTPLKCYIDDDYIAFLSTLGSEDALALKLEAEMNNGDKLHMYEQTETNRFYAFVIGPDNAGQSEACLVAEGKNLIFK